MHLVAALLLSVALYRNRIHVNIQSNKFAPRETREMLGMIYEAFCLHSR